MKIEIPQYIIKESSDKLKQQFKELLDDIKLEVGKTVYDVNNKSYVIVEVLENDKFKVSGNYSISGTTILDSSEITNILDLYHTGADPFVKNKIITKFINLSLEGIMGMLGIGNCRNRTDEDIKNGVPPYSNFDPYFIEKDGTKTFYQRGLVWTIEQKQALIDTIYKGQECGRMIVHLREYTTAEKYCKLGYHDYAQRDIVDGKQRISTIIEFYQDKFQDSYGNYFSDLSPSAKSEFRMYQGLSYGEIADGYKKPLTKNQILSVFINNIVTGTPVDSEHINYINSLIK